MKRVSLLGRLLPEHRQEPFLPGFFLLLKGNFFLRSFLSFAFSASPIEFQDFVFLALEHQAELVKWIEQF